LSAFGKDKKMKVRTQGKEMQAIAIPFRGLMQRAVVPSLVVPKQERAALTVIAPALHGAEVERVRRQQELEMRERERELQRMRRVQEPVHRSD
jgi:hypothetical protein